MRSHSIRPESTTVPILFRPAGTIPLLKFPRPQRFEFFLYYTEYSVDIIYFVFDKNINSCVKLIFHYNSTVTCWKPFSDRLNYDKLRISLCGPINIVHLIYCILFTVWLTIGAMLGFNSFSYLLHTINYCVLYAGAYYLIMLFVQ